MKGKANIITRRFNNPLINKVRSKIKIVTPNYNWNFIWPKRHVHIIAINLRMPTHTHTTNLPGGVVVCGTDIKIFIAHSYPNNTAYTVILYTMPKTYVTDMYFPSLSQYVCVGQHLHTQYLIPSYIYVHTVGMQ